jgi:hypothetical protein
VLRQRVPRGPVEGPGGSQVLIRVDLAGLWWQSGGYSGGSSGGGVLGLAAMLISLAIWWLVFRRAYTVHVRTNDRPPVKVHVRLPSEVTAYRAAAQLVSRFQDHGPAALPGWLADVTASI